VRRAIVAVATLAAGPGPVAATASPFPVEWAGVTASPSPVEDGSLDPLERAALSRCGPAERGLRTTARAIAAEKAAGRPMPPLDAIAFEQRAAGEPHPWARAWAATGRPLGAESTMRALDGWLAEDTRPALRRCGTALAHGADGGAVLVVVAVEALADLAPLPIRARVGQWLTVEARMRVAAYGGSVIVLGPGTPPMRALTSFEGGVLRARFAANRPGEFSVQVVAEVAGGPRPVAEATVFADVDPPSGRDVREAPGEDVTSAGADDDALGRMLAVARAESGLAPLPRDRRLDAIALAHAQRMAASHQLAHDLGDGSPVARLEAAGLQARETGENIADAPTVALAHRALWASPSHRANMLRPEYDRVGLAVARDGRGEGWVVEMFAAGLR
jgi:uncharacterized protein YkwD